MACADDPAGEWPDLEPGAKEQHGVDFTTKLTRFWSPDTDFATNTAVRPRASTGFQYRSSGGHSSGREPLWPKTLAGVVVDGSITWTCEAISTTSLLNTISGTPTWTADTGITVTGPTVNGQQAFAILDAASAISDTDYGVLVTATLADGQILKKRCILPIRQAQRVCCA